jgi:hypothetical protein
MEDLAACIAEIRNARNISVGKTEGNKSLDRPYHRTTAT